jgi:hypothetical protein
VKVASICSRRRCCLVWLNAHRLILSQRSNDYNDLECRDVSNLPLASPPWATSARPRDDSHGQQREDTKPAEQLCKLNEVG